jgi:hypothetical protein
MALEEALQKQAEAVVARMVELGGGDVKDEVWQTAQQRLLAAHTPQQLLGEEVVEVAKKMVEWRGRDMS